MQRSVHFFCSIVYKGNLYSNLFIRNMPDMRLHLNAFGVVSNCNKVYFLFREV